MYAGSSPFELPDRAMSLPYVSAEREERKNPNLHIFLPDRETVWGGEKQEIEGLNLRVL